MIVYYKLPCPPASSLEDNCMRARRALELLAETAAEFRVTPVGKPRLEWMPPVAGQLPGWVAKTEALP